MESTVAEAVAAASLMSFLSSAVQIGIVSSNIADAILAPLIKPSLVFRANASVISFFILSSSWHVVGSLTSLLLLWLSLLPSSESLSSRAFTFSACSAPFFAAISSSNAVFNSSSLATFTCSLSAISIRSLIISSSKVLTFSVSSSSVNMCSSPLIVWQGL